MASVRKLIVEVVDAHNLAPTDGHGTSSAYVVIDFYGQRRKTKVVARDLNPVWNEVLEFNVGKSSDVFGDTVEVEVHHDKTIGPTNRNTSLGIVRLNSQQFVKKGEEALLYYKLEKKHLFSLINGEIGLKTYFVDEAALPPPEEAMAEVKPEGDGAPAADMDKEKPNEEPPRAPETVADGGAPPLEGSDHDDVTDGGDVVSCCPSKKKKKCLGIKIFGLRL